MAEITGTYRYIAVLVNKNALGHIRHNLGILNNRNYVEIDEGDFTAYNVSIPSAIGQDLYDHILDLFDMARIDYVKIYNEEV